ncbi:MAG: TonB-dependent receptor, partial [Bryobacterales bacterium]|nr:TonB-dependent receptor [Bryobacterales bacterium]
MLDGADNNETLFGVAVMVPSVDALQEFKVQTANYSAEFGRAAGAVINVSIKSGTNELHGSAYEFLRNNAMDARDFFAVGTPPLRRNQFGFSLGGPVVKNKLFLFGNWEALKERRANTRGFQVPSAALRNGDFSGLATIFDPATQVGTGTRTPFPGNRIPDARIHAVSRKILPLWPAANNLDPARPYVQNFNNPLDRD